MSFSSKEIKFGGKKFFYRVTGSGKPVILIHGFGETGEVWNEQAAFLSGSYRIIIPDLPGSGRSEAVEDMSMENLAEAVHAIIHEEDIHACPVIGHSMGGYVALALAESYYNHVSALGLFHSTTYADSEEKKETRRKGIGFIRDHGVFEFLQSTSPNLFSRHTKERSPELVRAFIEGLRGFEPASLIAYYEGMMARPDRTAVLRNLHVPMLFVIGEYDAAVSPDDSLQQSYIPAISYVHMLKHSAHMGMLEEKDISNAILKEFLDGVK
ncbi:alpha/beta hydrolase [Terrimonas sp. NA20]|uniref:Alpha/beta hydrolase n=1 Tax=Terrimonas ginsenosidimutans TaxID=2908004 RepID=A0ABS9KPD1_9BACT|nr:alpha/beta hydrolase [Terrimonas ginsenosidimutans]MCG2614161.1 alpha/beta hydrolase [Terrimonas ginsenosidimutans]